MAALELNSSQKSSCCLAHISTPSLMGIRSEQPAFPVAIVKNVAEQLAKGTACTVAAGDIFNGGAMEAS